MPRRPVSEQLIRQLEKIIVLLRRHFPEREAAARYLYEWSHRCSTQGLERPLDLGLLLQGRPLHSTGLPTHTPRPAGPKLDVPAAIVKVVRARPGSLPASQFAARATLPDFTQWLNRRLAQGIPREQAIQEWNGAALLRQALQQ